MASLFIELRQQIESDIGGLVIRGIGAGDIGAERADGGFARERHARLRPKRKFRGMTPGDQSGGDGFDVAFDARNLAGEKNLRDRCAAAAWE